MKKNIMISIDCDQLKEFDEYCRLRGASRSGAMRVMIDTVLLGYEKRDITNQEILDILDRAPGKL